jgi:hypothetical protein
MGLATSQKAWDRLNDSFIWQWLLGLLEMGLIVGAVLAAAIFYS